MSTSTLDKHSAALDAAEDTTGHLITVTFRIRRFNPEVSDQAGWQDFRFEIDPKERVVVISTANGLKFTDFKIRYHENTLDSVSAHLANRPVELANDFDTVRRVIDAAVSG